MSERGEFTPAVGTRGEPAAWHPADEHADVAPAERDWADASWSFLYGRDTRYGGAEPGEEGVAAANRRMRAESMPEDFRGPFVKPPVWTWEGPVYMWVGGIAAGSAFVALAADLAGDEWSASVARKVALGAVAPAPLLLIADLGRPARFMNMLRIFKPRSPMNMGAWCLAAFSAAGATTVALDLVGRRRPAQAAGALTAGLGAYLGSYTGVLLASTAIPVWARSRIFLGPAFASTATATGAAATQLALVATGRRPAGHPTRTALDRLGTAAMLAELVLSALNERRLGRAGKVLSEGTAGHLFRAAKGLAGTGVALNLLRAARTNPVGRPAAGVLYLAAGLVSRFAWLEAGKASARDDEAVALTARARAGKGSVPGLAGRHRPRASRVLRAWSGGVGRASLVAERLLRRG